MDRLFLDANVFFAAAYSAKGASRFLLEWGARGKVELFSSEYALSEALKNLKLKGKEEHLIEFYKCVSGLEGILDHSFKGVEALSRDLKGVVPEKDLPILVGACGADADFLITLDRKHFTPELPRLIDLPFEIRTPGDYVRGLL